MKYHTTHFDDCGCLSADYKKRISDLEQELFQWIAFVQQMLKHLKGTKTVHGDLRKELEQEIRKEKMRHE